MNRQRWSSSSVCFHLGMRWHESDTSHRRLSMCTLCVCVCVPFASTVGLLERRYFGVCYVRNLQNSYVPRIDDDNEVDVDTDDDQDEDEVSSPFFTELSRWKFRVRPRHWHGFDVNLISTCLRFFRALKTNSDFDCTIIKWNRPVHFQSCNFRIHWTHCDESFLPVTGNQFPERKKKRKKTKEKW